MIERIFTIKNIVIMISLVNLLLLRFIKYGFEPIIHMITSRNIYVQFCVVEKYKQRFVYSTIWH